MYHLCCKVLLHAAVTLLILYRPWEAFHSSQMKPEGLCVCCESPEEFSYDPTRPTWKGEHRLGSKSTRIITLSCRRLPNRPVMFSTPDSLSSGTTLYEKTLPVSRGTASLAASDKKSVPGSLAPQPPAPTRSTVASVCIVAACTSSLMMSIALGPPVSVLLPYADKDLHIQKENLQWILNAYSISSVNNFKRMQRHQ